MTNEARYYPRARLDLIEQAAYLSDSASLETADRFLDAAEQTVVHLSELPRTGRIWQGSDPESRPRIRIWKVKGFPKVMIFYRPDPDGIVVIRVLHSARDLPPLLAGYV